MSDLDLVGIRRRHKFALKNINAAKSGTTEAVPLGAIFPLVVEDVPRLVAEIESLRRERTVAGGVFGRLGRIAAERAGVSDNLSATKHLDAIERALMECKP